MRKIIMGVFISLCILLFGYAAEAEAPVPIGTNETIRLNTASSDAPIVSYGNATNVIIFICFSDEDPSDVRASIPSDFRERCNGDDNSIKDYYDKLSYGKFSFYSLFPSYSDGSIYIYRDSHPRSYYTNNSSSSGSGRTGPESTLLNNAIYEASSYLDLRGQILDVNGDGYVDCVTFLISGNYNDKNWNKLMWPHSWQLDDICKEYNSSASASIGGKRVNDYTFLFIDTVSTRLGLMCHELGHAVGNLPDLYHYKSSYSQYLPVGYWDLMHLDCDTPQYMTTYLRLKYLSFVNENQIKEMEKSGDYTLTPTTTAGANDTLCYKLTIDNGTATPNESIWIEYRRNDVSTYDADLPGSGLLVYRINTKAEEGNKNARYQNDKYPDEVYVFRPDVSQKSSTSEKEKENLSYAYVSSLNKNFSTLGNASSSTKYDPTCIFLSNGNNTGIVLTVKEETKDHVTFHIELGKYDSSEIDYKASYIQGNTNNKNKVEIYYGEDIKSQISLYVKRNNRGIYRADDSSFILIGDDLTSICEDGKTAYIEYTDDFGTYRFSYLLIVHDKLVYDNKDDYPAVIINLPDKSEYNIGEELSLDGLIIQATYLSGIRNIFYGQTEEEAWQVVGYDKTHSGTQDITVTYNNEAKVHFTVVVLSDIVSIRIDEKNSNHIKNTYTMPHYNVIATYADGTEKGLSDGDYFVITEDAEYNFAKTNVLVVSVENDQAACSSYYWSIPQNMTSLSIATSPRRTYRYGEALDLSGGKLQASFGGFSLDGDNALPMDNYFDHFSGFSPTKVGKQTLRLQYEEATLSMDVTVQPLPENLLVSTDDDILVDESRSIIILKKDCTLAELSSATSSYLTVYYLYTVGNDTFSVLPETYGEQRLCGSFSVILKNNSDALIKQYEVFRCGDGNNDGTIDKKDVLYWNRSLVAREEMTKGVLFDKNGDNRYTLTDYVLLMDEVKEAE